MAGALKTTTITDRIEEYFSMLDDFERTVTLRVLQGIDRNLRKGIGKPPKEEKQPKNGALELTSEETKQ